MNYSQNIRTEINKFEETELINSNSIYISKFTDIPEFTFYKTIERMVKKNELVRISKGIYVRPKKTEYGDITFNENKVLSFYLDQNKGIYKGYHLFNLLGLTTQISKNIELYSNMLNEETKTINQFKIFKLPIKINDDNKYLIELLEVLENYYKIEDLNQSMFLRYIEKSAYKYNEESINALFMVKKYKKSTIAFLESILNKYEIKNTLRKYLSHTSKYNIPELV